MNVKQIRINKTAVFQRSITFLYIGILIILPILAICIKALDQGLYVFLEELNKPQALYSLKLTFITAFIMLIINIITGTATAYVLVRYQFPGKKIMNSIIDLPFAIPTVVTGIMLVTLYGPNSVLGTIMSKYNIEIIFSKPGIILSLLFVTFPFVVRSVQPVLLEMSGAMEEAAKTLGANPIQIFVKIVLPTILPAILTGAALSFSRALGEFGSIAIAAGNIPFKTQMASVYIYGEIESYNTNGALVLSAILLLCSFITLILLNFFQKWSRRHEENNQF